MKLEIPDMLPLSMEVMEDPLGYFIKLTPDELMIHDVELSPSPLTFIHKYVLGLGMPVAVAFSYLENLQTCVAISAILAKEKGSPESLLTIINAIDKYLTSIVNFWNGQGRMIYVEYAVTMSMHASALSMHDDTDAIRSITKVSGLDQYAECYTAFNKLHADLLDEMQECYLNRSRIRVPKTHLTLVH